MRSLHVHSLFTDIPLEEIIYIRPNTFFENLGVEGLSKNLRNFYLLLQKNPIYFNRKLCKLVNGVIMNSPLRLTLANAFLVYFQKNWLQNCPSDFKSHYYRWYPDDIFLWFTSPEHLDASQNFLNDRHASMLFTIENEKQNRMSFLDVQIICEDKTFTTTVYQKAAFSGGYTHFDSFLSSTYKFGTIYTLAYGCF